MHRMLPHRFDPHWPRHLPDYNSHYFDNGLDGRVLAFPHHGMHDNNDVSNGIGTRSLPTTVLDIVPSGVNRQPKDLADVITMWAYDEGRKHGREYLSRDIGMRQIFETANALKRKDLVDKINEEARKQNKKDTPKDLKQKSLDELKKALQILKENTQNSNNKHDYRNNGYRAESRHGHHKHHKHHEYHGNHGNGHGNGDSLEAWARGDSNSSSSSGSSSGSSSSSTCRGCRRH